LKIHDLYVEQVVPNDNLKFYEQELNRTLYWSWKILSVMEKR